MTPVSVLPKNQTLMEYVESPLSLEPWTRGASGSHVQLDHGTRRLPTATPTKNRCRKKKSAKRPVAIGGGRSDKKKYEAPGRRRSLVDLACLVWVPLHIPVWLSSAPGCILLGCTAIAGGADLSSSN
ncbi:hypothetical protein MRX96_001509 [Rhipicephalus microplus]